MLFLMSLIYLSSFWKKMRKYFSVLLVMATFIYFNTAFFIQHVCWVVPFIPLSLSDTYSKKA
jgi:hypothetical protein